LSDSAGRCGSEEVLRSGRYSVCLRNWNWK
jgi:hypothetical protein